MVFTKDQYDTFMNGDERSAIHGSNYRWSNNELIFKFDNTLNSEQKQKVRNVVSTMNNEFSGCVKIM